MRKDIGSDGAFAQRSCSLAPALRTYPPEPRRSYFAPRDLQVHHIDVLRQGLLVPGGDVIAVGARVIPALLVHCLDVRRQVALRPKGDALAVKNFIGS